MQEGSQCRVSGFVAQTQGEDWSCQQETLKGLKSGVTTTKCVSRGSLVDFRGQVPLFGGCMRGEGQAPPPGPRQALALEAELGRRVHWEMPRERAGGGVGRV